ncbi:MAG: hypothetical protein JSR24_20785 [Proteobacteria bacterium]|nr:hypothetical protein [Pseudomonadota bacterium]
MDKDEDSTDLNPTPNASRGTRRVLTPADAENFPREMDGDWRIQMRYLPILHRGHAYLALIGPDNKIHREMHGLSQSRNTNELVPLGMDGAKLVGVETDYSPFYDPVRGVDSSKGVSTVYRGPYADVMGKWRTGQQAAAEINSKDLDYKAHDPSYEMGTDGGEIQNSNSLNFTVGKPMHIDLSTAIRNKGLERKFPGWGRDMLDPTYRPYVAPPQVQPNTP